MSAAYAFSFLGIPIDSVGQKGGTEFSPRVLRGLGLVERLGGADLGDLPVTIRDSRRDPASGIIGYEEVIATSRTVRAAVRERIAGGERLFLAGGCCTQMIGAMAGTRDALRDMLGADTLGPDRRAGIVYLDGHLDLYDGVTSPTGEAADIPLATMLGHGPEKLIAAMDGPSLRPEDVALLGYRDLDHAAGQGSLLPADFGPDFIHADASALRREGMAAAGWRIATRFTERQVPFWLFLDVDVLTPGAMPATDYLFDGGLAWGELAELMQPFMRSPMLLGLALTCYNPEKDDGYRCGEAIVNHFSLLREASRAAD